MNSNYFFLPLLLLLVHAGSRAQSPVPATGDEQRFMLEKIEEASRKMTSLTCDFVQEKELSILDERMVSTGRMYYRQDNRLRWEYLSPYLYTFILNDKRILMQTGMSRNVVDVKSSKLFQEIVKIMMNSVNGRGLTDVKSFTAAFYRAGAAWKVSLVPVQRETRKVFSAIELTFNATDYTVDEVKMDEPNGDATLIRLSNKRFNEPLDDETFAID
jgi:outer membrane lipoprotein carrier protein